MVSHEFLDRGYTWGTALGSGPWGFMFLVPIGGVCPGVCCFRSSETGIFQTGVVLYSRFIVFKEIKNEIPNFISRILGNPLQIGSKHKLFTLE